MSELKTENKIDLQVINELCIKIRTNLNAAHHYLAAIAEIERTRETAMINTKIDEALLWLGKFEDMVDDKLEDMNPHRI